jgi:hypothetical protein
MHIAYGSDILTTHSVVSPNALLSIGMTLCEWAARAAVVEWLFKTAFALKAAVKFTAIRTCFHQAPLGKVRPRIARTWFC